MSTNTTLNDSPVVMPLHNPTQAAHILVPQAPLGVVANNAPGIGAKAFLAKKIAKTHNSNFVSPTDKLMTPCTQKLSAAKKKQFDKVAKPTHLFAEQERPEETESVGPLEESPEAQHAKMDVDENPF